MRALPFAGALAGLLLVAACSSPVQHQAGDAAPAGAPTPTSAAPTTTPPTPPPSSPPTSPVAPDPEGNDAPILGHEGYGALKIGMSVRQAEATGLVTTFDDSGCRGAHLRDAGSKAAGGVLWSPRYGIVSIAAWKGVETPEGVGVGTSAAELQRIYPNWEIVDTNGDFVRGWVTLTKDTRYRITTDGGKVNSVTLQHTHQDCYE
ncbi:hypothetical protein [Asanoa sp. NPDC050611]|uniref:hypothetical protein n=1 Tax=Asanoa sp. NPDC050611 TaxID=3157098 RepID=UPI0033DAF306